MGRAGTDNVLSDTTTSFVPQKQSHTDEDPVVLSFAGIESTIFEKNFCDLSHLCRTDRYKNQFC